MSHRTHCNFVTIRTFNIYVNGSAVTAHTVDTGLRDITVWQANGYKPATGPKAYKAIKAAKTRLREAGWIK